MSDQNIIPSERKEASASATSVAASAFAASAPPLYPTLPDENVSSFRLKKICDCQKELENEISHYRKVSKKYKRANSIAHTSSTLTGIRAIFLCSLSTFF